MKTSDMTKGMGYAAAAAVVLFVIIMFFTAINSWVSNKRVHY
jgi:ABC-type sugar transport system permease subunit